MMTERLLSVRVLSVLSALLLLGLFTINQRLLMPHNRLPDRPQRPLPLQSAGDNPGLQLQLAWLASHHSQILDPTNAPDVLTSNLGHVNDGNSIDSFVFVPLYLALLLALGALGFVAGGRRSKWLFTAIVAGAALVVIADWLENLAILEVVRHVTHSPIHQAHPTALDLDAFDVWTSAVVKWLSLAIVLGMIGWQFVRAGIWWSWLLALAAFGLAAVLVYGLTAYARERIWYEPPSPVALSIKGTNRG